MKAMILAAGRGERMRPLTDTLPKPLLAVGGKPLIVWHLERLARAGFHDIVVNYAHLGDKIKSALGTGQAFGLNIEYSPEPPGALETAGGIAQALPLLGDAPFLVVNGDIWCDWDVMRAQAIETRFAHLVMVNNPKEHASGDFILEGGLLRLLPPRHYSASLVSLTYAGVGVFSPDFFKGLPAGVVMKLRPLLDRAILAQQVTGEHHQGEWTDVGTPDRLMALDQHCRQQAGVSN